MEKLCNDCVNYDEDYDNEEIKDRQQLIEKFNKNIKRKQFQIRPIDFNSYNKSLYKALLFPEYAKGFKFPSTFQIPTYTFQQKTSFTFRTNTSGNALVQVNLGQFLNSTNFIAAGATGPPVVPPISNVFTCIDDLNSASPALNQFTGIDALQVQQLSVGGSTTPYFTAVRAGPILVKYEYIGRLDVVAGTVTMGIAFSNVPSVTRNSVSYGTGLQPDNNYRSLQSIEDLNYSRTVPSTETMRAVYIPHDYTLLNLKSSDDSSSTMITQRLCILLTANANSDPGAAGRITIVANWEGIPSPGVADIISTSYNENAPSNYYPSDVFDSIIKNNLVIVKEEEIEHLRV